MTLAKLLQTVHTTATVSQIDHEGFGNKDGTYSNVPYQILIHLYSGPKERNELKRLTDIFRARIIDVSDTTYTIELTGVAEKIIAFMNSLGKIKIVEMVRSGALGISRGAQGLQTKE